MPWWGWIIVGAILLGAEMTIVDLELYLVFLGVSALVTGLLELGGLPLPPWGQWLLFAGLAVLSMITLRGPIYRRLHRDSPNIEEPLLGGGLVLTQDLDAGARGREEFRGTQWTVHNAGEQPLTAGQRVEITAVNGLTLTVS